MTGDLLLARVERLREAAAMAQQRRRDDAHYSRTGRLREDASRSATFIAQFLAGLGWCWSRIVRPALAWAMPPVRWAGRQYLRLWDRAVHRRSGDRMVFSRTRAGGMVAATFVFAWFIAWPVIDCCWDGAMYAVTAERGEHVYLLGSQEINSWTGAHVIEGCSTLPCADTDAIYFRTEGGLFNNLWSIVHGRGLFYPEFIGAAVPSMMSRCVVTSYGVRVRFPFHLINTYSHLLAVTCSPLSGAESPRP